MQLPTNPSSVRILGEMLLSHKYDNVGICIMGYSQDVRVQNVCNSSLIKEFTDVLRSLFQMKTNSKQFMLKTTDGKSVPVNMSRPIDECLDGLLQIRGIFDGQKIQGQSYNHLLKEICEDFGIKTI